MVTLFLIRHPHLSRVWEDLQLGTYIKKMCYEEINHYYKHMRSMQLVLCWRVFLQIYCDDTIFIVLTTQDTIFIDFPRQGSRD